MIVEGFPSDVRPGDLVDVVMETAAGRGTLTYVVEEVSAQPRARVTLRPVMSRSAPRVAVIDARSREIES